MKNLKLLLLLLFVGFGCSEEIADTPQINSPITKELTIFFINDQHGELDNFAKIKEIVDKERQTTNVLVACSGDIFSGNPVVDYYPEKGFPIIDVMNEVGFDISVIGNHEFDYGQEILKKRMAQADFEWVCANVDMGTTGIPEPAEYKTIQIDDLKVTFLGLVETNGKQDGIIPSTHPGKVKDFVFKRFENITGSYANIKKQEDSDIFVALTHLGTGSDFRLAQDFPYFDVIIGGHSHAQINEKVNNIPVYQTRGKLRSLGKIKMTIENKEITKLDYTLIDRAHLKMSHTKKYTLAEVENPARCWFY
jgi:5'-nucleotidase/UDP-sugar diphosphatase